LAGPRNPRLGLESFPLVSNRAAWTDGLGQLLEAALERA
jgi:hypothetical protein